MAKLTLKIKSLEKRSLDNKRSLSSKPGEDSYIKNIGELSAIPSSGNSNKKPYERSQSSSKKDINFKSEESEWLENNERDSLRDKYNMKGVTLQNKFETIEEGEEYSQTFVSPTRRSRSNLDFPSQLNYTIPSPHISQFDTQNKTKKNNVKVEISNINPPKKYLQVGRSSTINLENKQKKDNYSFNFNDNKNHSFTRSISNNTHYRTHTKTSCKDRSINRQEIHPHFNDKPYKITHNNMYDAEAAKHNKERTIRRQMVRDVKVNRDRQIIYRYKVMRNIKMNNTYQYNDDTHVNGMTLLYIR